MRLVKPAFVLKNSNRTFAKKAITEEKNIFHTVIPKVAPIYVSFFIVDIFVTSPEYFLDFILIRLAAVIVSSLSFLVSRGRVRYMTRFFLCFAPYLLALEYIVIKYELGLTPYYAGFSLILFPTAIFLSMKLRLSLVAYTMSMLPFLFYCGIQVYLGDQRFLTPFLMTVGMIFLCAVNSNQMYFELLKKLDYEEALKLDIRDRKKIIAQKVKEITARRQFEKQFSPQVIESMLDNPDQYKKMQQNELVIIVFDIVDSTKKSTEIPPLHYKNVVEEIFDLINFICGEWNITVDKFTGDGAQVFAGSPKAYPNDLERAINASSEFLKLINKKQGDLKQMWQGDVHVRIGICQGEALVGFLGRGNIKSFTAIGNNVSFTHRLCGATSLDEILVFTRNPEKLMGELETLNISKEIKSIGGLKGIEGEVKVLSLKNKDIDSKVLFYGYCPTCGTQLELSTDLHAPKVICSNCTSGQKKQVLVA